MSEPKLAGVKSLLLRAWRERWPDVQWSINVKKLLPSSGNCDNFHLAELLLQQALTGSSPNNLVLSYLKHAMCSQMVTCTAVIRSIVKYEDISKPYCVRSLLDVVTDFTGRISLKGSSEASLTLACSLLSLIKWLTDIIFKSLQRLSDEKQTIEYVNLVDKSADVFRLLLETQTSHALLYIARLEDTDVFREIEQNEVNIRGFLSHTQVNAINSVREKLDTNLSLLNRIQTWTHKSETLIDIQHQPLNVSLNGVLTLEAVLNPTNDIQPLVEQILVIEQLQGLSRSDLYCEVLRTCLLGSIDSVNSSDEIKWVAFTFLKLPQALVSMTKQASDETSQHSSDESPQQSLELAFDKLLHYSALLNLADSKCNCDWLSTLLNELSTKFSLLSDAKVKAILHKRQSYGIKPRQQETSSTQQPSGSLILRAEPTVISILKQPGEALTLDADYSKNQDALLGVLCHMLSGKSFELILAAAAAKGKLQSFAVKLIKFNEFAKQTPGKNAQTSALLFDITFLMLCHIIQLYGIELVMSSMESSDSFFVQWATRCLPEDNKYRSLEMHLPKDQTKVDMLLQQFNTGSEIKANLSRWHEVCQNVPYAVHEVLIAWECGALSAEQVKGILDTVKGRMCCLPVVVSTWLSSYINTIDEENRKKPLTMLQQLITPIHQEQGSMCSPVQLDQTNHYSERCNLMVVILTRIIQEVLPPSAIRRNMSYMLPLTQPARAMLLETYTASFQQSSVNIKAIHKFEHLLSVSGPKWFCDQLVREVLSQSRVEDINKGVSLVYALFHLNLEPLTICLLQHTIPGLLHGGGPATSLLTDPRGRALAQLAIMCLVITHRMRNIQKESQVFKKRESRKRARADLDLDDCEDGSEESQPSKIRRLAVHDENLSLHSEGFNLGELLASKEEAEPLPSYDTKDPLNRAMMNLLRLFASIVSCSQVSPKTNFVMAFIEETVKSGTDTAKFILQFMPLTMVSQLMRCLPKAFTTDLLMNVCDLSHSVGRKVAAKVVCQNARFSRLQKQTSGSHEKGARV